MQEILESADDLHSRANSALVKWRRGEAAETCPQAQMLQAALSDYYDLRQQGGSNIGDINQEMATALENYGNHYLDPGGFLQAVLANDLAAAVERASVSNRFAIGTIAAYILKHVPDIARGNEQAVKDWLAKRTS